MKSSTFCLFTDRVVECLYFNINLAARNTVPLLSIQFRSFTNKGEVIVVLKVLLVGALKEVYFKVLGAPANP